MKEKLIIKNFGPIKSVELDLGRFNILIGEQATGKSTVAKVLAVCRYFSYIIGGNTNYSPFDTFSAGLKAWGLSGYTRESTIYYSCRHYSLTYQYWLDIPFSYQNESDDEPTIVEQDQFDLKLEPVSPEFKMLLSELDKVLLKHPSKQVWNIPTSFFLNDVKSVVENPFYLPTERGLQSVFSLGQESIPNLASFLFRYFSKIDGILQSSSEEIEIEPLNILYVNKNGVGYIRKKDEKELHLLSNSASGYQSMIPIVLVIKYYQLQQRSKTFIIEEPEQNLFPSAQNKLMHYLVDKTLSNGNSMLVTTHSPYTLTSINNLIYAYQIGQKYPDEVAKEIDKKYWLNPNDVSAYRLLKDGTAINILDEELKQINTGEIDEISGIINDEWDKIADIEFDKR